MPMLLAAVDFPPPVPPADSRWPLYVAVFTLCVGSFLGVLWRSARTARAVDLLAWLIIAPMGALAYQLSSIGREIDPGTRYVLAGFVAVNSLAGFVVTALRLRNPAVPRIALAAGCLLSFNFITAWLLPPVSSGRTAARRTVCKNNLHNIGTALWEYVDLHKSLPAPVVGRAETPRSWRVELLPWLDERALRDKYDDNATWDSAANLEHAKSTIPSYHCPSHYYFKDDAGRVHTSFVAMTGPNTAFSDAIRAEFPKAVTDGTSNTLLIAEACGQQIVWTEPRDVDPSKHTIGINVDGESRGRSEGIASSYHTGGAHVVCADGAVRFLSENIDPAILKALTTANGGDKIDEF